MQYSSLRNTALYYTLLWVGLWQVTQPLSITTYLTGGLNRIMKCLSARPTEGRTMKDLFPVPEMENTEAKYNVGALVLYVWSWDQEY